MAFIETDIEDACGGLVEQAGMEKMALRLRADMQTEFKGLYGYAPTSTGIVPPS